MTVQRLVRRCCLLLLSTSIIIICQGSAQAQARPVAGQKYHIYAIRYATLVGYPVASLVVGADPSRKMDLAMMVWLVRGNGKNILVDAGFYRERWFHDNRFHVKSYIRPSEAITKVGLKPEDITDIIVTHMHWDHADGISLFPKARIWIQNDEYNYYAGEAWSANETHQGIDADDVLDLVRLNLDGRVSLVQGDNQQIIPGITCYTGGRHTYASQYVGVNTGSSTIILASDNVYVTENLTKHVPIAATLDAGSNLRAQDRMKQLASSPRLIIPGHDPDVFTTFHIVADGVAQLE